MSDVNNKPSKEPREPKEPRSLHIDPKTFAHVVESLHTLTQTMPSIMGDMQSLRGMMLELGVSVSALVSDISTIAEGVRSQNKIPLQSTHYPPQQGMLVAPRPSREELAATLRALPGVGPDDSAAHEFNERALQVGGNNKR